MQRLKIERRGESIDLAVEDTHKGALRMEEPKVEITSKLKVIGASLKLKEEKDG